MRRLIWVPIIHAGADMGSLKDSVRELYMQEIGPDEWEKHTTVIDEMWRDIGEEIEQLHLDYRRVRLYQDGLPDCGREKEIVTKLAESGSQNYQLLLSLMERGAQLTGTESSALLTEEYELARRLLDCLDSQKKGGASWLQSEVSRSLLARRDKYIAGRIDRTLDPSQSGLIFLGMLHSLHTVLPADIEVRVLARSVRRAMEKSRGKALGSRRSQK